jgi:hypothetical protein
MATQPSRVPFLLSASLSSLVIHSSLNSPATASPSSLVIHSSPATPSLRQQHLRLPQNKKA